MVEAPAYEPLDTEVDFSKLEGLWADAQLEFDSAVRAHVVNTNGRTTV